MRRGQNTRADSRGRGRTRQLSPASSNSSGLSLLSQSPSPPPGRRRKPSPAMSDSSELSVLSRSPSPPPGLALVEHAPSPKPAVRGPNGRFVRKSAKRAASPSPPTLRSSKRLRASAPVQEAQTPASPRALRSSRKLRTPAQAKQITTATSVVVAATTAREGGSGNLARLPKEIRQQIYGYCLEVDEPVCVKQCCGPTSTRRERASCKKHGDLCSKIGKGNGLTLYDEDMEATKKQYGRFNILTVSHEIHEEASWVLHTHGRVLVQSTEALQAYLTENDCTFHRLPNFATEHAKHMWTFVARFRNVCFELPWDTQCLQDPVAGVYRLYEATAFLMKACSLQSEESALSRNVTVQLNSLYTAVIPYNSHISASMAEQWTALWQSELEPSLEADFHVIGNKTDEILKRMLELVGRHGRETQWKVVAHAHDGYNEDPMKEKDMQAHGPISLMSLEAWCSVNHVKFEAVE